MTVTECDIPGVKHIEVRRFSDARGSFAETWNDRAFRKYVYDSTFLQDNHSISEHRGTIRGLHFQKPPFAQGKLIWVVRGAILDVAVDIRKGSPTFGHYVAKTLSACDGRQLWIPAGFLHGFCTLEDKTEVFYKVTDYYSAEHDAGVLWNDPDLAIPWPVELSSAVLSEKDKQLPRFRDLPAFFRYYG
jgi:dTDP-4-dehydrorhamnose 3,5-epimerase